MPKWWLRNEMLQQKHTFYITAKAWINLSDQRVLPHYFQTASPSSPAWGRRCVAGHSRTMHCFPHATDSWAKIPKGTFPQPPRAPSHTGSRLALPEGGVLSVSPNQSHLLCLSASHRLLCVGIHPLHGCARRPGYPGTGKHSHNDEKWGFHRLCDSSSLFKDEVAEVFPMARWCLTLCEGSGGWGQKQLALGTVWNRGSSVPA